MTDFLTTKAAAEFLTVRGFPIAAATLDTRVTRGGGPRFCRWGKRRLYRPGDLLEWANSRLGAPRRSSSEADAAR